MCGKRRLTDIWADDLSLAQYSWLVHLNPHITEWFHSFLSLLDLHLFCAHYRRHINYWNTTEVCVNSAITHLMNSNYSAIHNSSNTWSTLHNIILNFIPTLVRVQSQTLKLRCSLLYSWSRDCMQYEPRDAGTIATQIQYGSFSLCKSKHIITHKCTWMVTCH